MAFSNQGLVQVSTVFAPWQSKDAQRLPIWQYAHETDTLATILAANYFADIYNNGILYDGVTILIQDNATPTTIVARVYKIDDDVVLYYGQPAAYRVAKTGLVAATSTTLTVAGAAVGDVVLVTVDTISGTAGTYVASSTVSGANTVTVTLNQAFTGDATFGVIIRSNASV